MNGGIYLLNMGNPIRVLDLAKKMIKLSGFSVKEENSSNGDIEIVFSGLRPGEKLHEELMIGGKAEITKNNDIYEITEEFVEWPELSNVLINLEKAIKNYEIDSSIKIIGSLTNLNYQLKNAYVF